jgi:hypothetical protein
MASGRLLLDGVILNGLQAVKDLAWVARDLCPASYFSAATIHRDTIY